MGVYSVCRVLFSVILFILWRKLLFSVFHYSYHVIGTLENRIGDLLEEALSNRLFNLMETLIDEHNPLALIALYVADKIGKLFVAVVVYTGARIGMHLVENMEVKPLVAIKESVVTIKESVVDPIKEFVSEKSGEYDDVFKRHVVAPIGDYALQKIKKFLIAPFAVLGPFVYLAVSILIQMAKVCVIILLLLEPDKYLVRYLIQCVRARFTVSAPIEKYVLTPFIMVALITVIILIQKFVQMFIKPVLTRMLAVLVNMLALLAVLRVEYSIRDVKNFGDQIEHLRNTRKLVQGLVDAAKEKSEVIQVIQPSALKWLTSVREFIDESSNLHGFDQAKNLYSLRPTNADHFYYYFYPKMFVHFEKSIHKFA